MSDETCATVSIEIEDDLTIQIQTLHALVNSLERKGFVAKKEPID